MKNIKNINGLVVGKTAEGQRVVEYMGTPCPLINQNTELCEESTSYYGCILNSRETYQTPIGAVERHYWARGGGLERTGVDWRLLPVDEIEEVQRRFEAASRELEKARKALEMVVA